MDPTSFTIMACPPAWQARALQMVLRKLPREQQEVIATLAGDLSGLYLAVSEDVPIGACWAQPQPGNTAVLWPPQLCRSDPSAADLLLVAATNHLDQTEVALTQALLADRLDPAIRFLERHGFTELADLVYLSWEQFALTGTSDCGSGLSFEPFHPTETDRLKDLIEQTYTDTLDCPSLNGTRTMDDVLSGYQSTGEYRPELWYIVRRQQRDIGVLLLTTHLAIRHLELLYMGLVPSERGRGYGNAIVRHAQQVTAAAGCDRIVLAVDTKNRPAAQIYHRAGFQPWDRRLVYIRLAGGRSLPPSR
jgi:GNAT superfamily N-acetyltransferase